MPAVALCGGVALYLLALSALKRRNLGSFNRPRIVAARAAGRAGAGGDGGAGAGGAGAGGGRRVLALIAYETVRYAETRDRVRHG